MSRRTTLSHQHLQHNEQWRSPSRDYQWFQVVPQCQSPRWRRGRRTKRLNTIHSIPSMIRARFGNWPSRCRAFTPSKNEQPRDGHQWMKRERIRTEGSGTSAVLDVDAGHWVHSEHRSDRKQWIQRMYWMYRVHQELECIFAVRTWPGRQWEHETYWNWSEAQRSEACQPLRRCWLIKRTIPKWKSRRWAAANWLNRRFVQQRQESE